MRKIWYNQALFFCIKKLNPHIFTTSLKNKYVSHSKENHFIVYKMLNFLIIVNFTRKLTILVLSYSTLRPVLSALPMQNYFKQGKA